MPTAALKVFTVKRISEYNGGVYSVFEDEGEPFAVVCERRGVIIPAGEYDPFKSFYHAGNYDTYEIPVKGRTRILFHKGNFPTDSAGCLLVAESFGILKGRTAVIGSREGFGEFIARCHGAQTFKLVILER